MTEKLKEGQSIREAAEHLRLTSEHPAHGTKTNYLQEGMSVSIGRYAPQEMGKPPREHIQIHNDPEGFVSRNHGDISFEKGRIF
ncbi:hypothetical protein H0N99_02435, partial [Candidatus Micrarchaeota archaeon]|nr:hypothetical protein [Candidatus Micrarchaeota archaeon]